MKTSHRVHFIGIGGIGVSSLAQWFLAQGAAVSGSDASESELIDALRKKGITVTVGHRAENLPQDAEIVVYSQAIGKDNPERMEAVKRGLLERSYPEMIGELTQQYETLAVAGAHGKSTTTSLLSLILIEAKWDPTVIVGVKLRELDNGNFRAGASKYLVLEADEYRAAFEHYYPDLAIVTNIDLEHLDFYKDIDDIKSAFLQFMRQTGKVLILNYDNAVLRSIEKEITEIASNRGLELYWYSVRSVQAARLKQILRIPGEHNLGNAVAAFAASQALGIDEETAFRALERYEGAWRRMEYRGNYKNALVYDDYAHHPTEIKATLQAFREKYPNKTLLCVFEPHQTARLEKLFHEFLHAFDLADETLILPVYTVTGREESASPLSAEALVKEIQKEQPKKKLFYLAKPENIQSALDALGELDKKVIVMMGAGNIHLLSTGILAAS